MFKNLKKKKLSFTHSFPPCFFCSLKISLIVKCLQGDLFLYMALEILNESTSEIPPSLELSSLLLTVETSSTFRDSKLKSNKNNKVRIESPKITARTKPVFKMVKTTWVLDYDLSFYYLGDCFCRVMAVPTHTKIFRHTNRCPCLCTD